jgi:hypothetical protein
LRTGPGLLEPATVNDKPDRPRAVTYASRLIYAAIALAVMNGAVLVTQDGIHYLPLFVIGGVYIVVLGYSVGEGRNWARVLVWLSAAGVLVNEPILVLRFADGTYLAGRPAWFVPVEIAISALNLAELVTVAVLLALPSARPYFRKVAGQGSQ